MANNGNKARISRNLWEVRYSLSGETQTTHLWILAGTAPVAARKGLVFARRLVKREFLSGRPKITDVASRGQIDVF